jgi:hypothetical protein
LDQFFNLTMPFYIRIIEKIEKNRDKNEIFVVCYSSFCFSQGFFLSMHWGILL